MKYHCQMYVALRDFEYRNERVWCWVVKGEERPWFDHMVLCFPEIWRRLD